MRLFKTLFVAACLTGAPLGCDLSNDLASSSSPASPARRDPAGERQGRGAPTLDEPPGKQASLRVMAWNIEWFHDAEHGPRDDAAQYAAVKEILDSSQVDVVALAEVSDPASFRRLMRALPEHEGVIAEFDWTQKLALVYRDAAFEIVETRRVAGLPDAGRPPLHVQLRRKDDGFAFHVIAVHAKAGNEKTDWGQRRGLALGLKAYLESELPDAPVIIAGDLNDRLNGSTVPRHSSPYEAFVLSPEVATPTRALHGRSEPSHLSGETLDHILVSDELAPFVDADSVDVLREELSARHPGFAEEVSDHFPVVLRLRR